MAMGRFVGYRSQLLVYHDDDDALDLYQWVKHQ